MDESENGFQCVLKNHLKKLNITEYTLEIASGSTTGDNFMAVVKRIDVYGKKDGKQIELHYVVKNAPTNEVFRKAHLTTSVYQREIYTYEKILPSFLDLQTKFKLPTLFESYPEYCMSSMVELKEFIMMKNMKVVGYQNCDKQRSFDFNHALLAIKGLGKLHALSFALRKKQVEVFGDICENARDIEYQPGFEVTSKYIMDLFCIFALKALDPLEDRVAFDKFYSFRKKIVDVIEEAVKDGFDSEHAVVVHGDCWIGNFLFKYQNNLPTDICFLDWQFLRVGSPAIDISQLFFLCCNKEVRNDYYSDLLQAYYESFSLFLNYFDEDANEVFPFHALLQHLSKYSVLGLATALRTTYLSSINSEDIPDVSKMKTMQENVNMFLSAKRNETLYNKLMRDIILDYISYGYDM